MSTSLYSLDGLEQRNVIEEILVESDSDDEDAEFVEPEGRNDL